MPETTKKPALRFAGFSDEWEERKINDVANFSKGNGYSKGDLKGSGTPIILYGRLYTKYQFEIEGVDTFADIRSGAVFSKGNEVIVPASGETAEDIARAAAILKSGILLGGDLNILHPFTFMNPSFVALVISNGPPQKELARKAQGKSIVHIHNSDIQEVTVRYPDRAEQDKISRTFSKLDHLIALHERKYSKLMNVKKFMLEKMFPKDGAKVPALRFAGFSGEWEERKLGDIGKARSGVGFPDVEQGGTEGIPFYKVSDMNLVGNEIEMTRSNNYVTNEQIEKKRWNPVDDVPAIFFAKVGAAVMLNRKRLCRFPFLLDNNTMAYSLYNDYWNMEFAKAAFTKIDFTKLIQVGALPSYNSGDVEDIRVMLPPMKEQNKIGQYFAHLDHLLSLHRQELERLQNVKKSCLEKMFA